VQSSRGTKESWHKKQRATPAAVRRVFFMRACVFPKFQGHIFNAVAALQWKNGLSLQQRNNGGPIINGSFPLGCCDHRETLTGANIWCFKSVVVKGFFGVAILCATFRMHLGGPTTQEKTNQERALTSLPGALGWQ
jgi:hypothetical protein